MVHFFIRINYIYQKNQIPSFTIEANKFKSITYINYQAIKVSLLYSLLGHIPCPGIYL